MIQINEKYVAEYVKGILEEKIIDSYDREIEIKIDDVDDLHDWTIESESICQIDRVYDALCALLPVIIDDVVEVLDDAYEDDVWGTYAMREGIGLCD